MNKIVCSLALAVAALTSANLAYAGCPADWETRPNGVCVYKIIGPF
jgi:hypothetical protein